jgi:hypothetical protein
MGVQNKTRVFSPHRTRVRENLYGQQDSPANAAIETWFFRFFHLVENEIHGIPGIGFYIGSN